MEVTMQAPVDNSQRQSAAAIMQAITSCLKHVQAASLSELIANTGYSVTSLRDALEQLAARGAIRVLQPVAAQPDPASAYYRLVRHSDRDHLWAQTLARPRPVSYSRLRHTREVESRATSRVNVQPSARGRLLRRPRWLIPRPGIG